MPDTYRTDIEIAREARLRPIEAVGAGLGIPADALLHYGPYKAKVTLDYLASLADRPEGRLILVTAITPTPAGEGKSTTTIGLGDALNRIGKRAVICIREPSMGPCFGQKGGATGGGLAQVAPMDEINLHFTGDFHAIGAANNLLAAMIDNHVYWGNALDLDLRRVTWRRVMDVNDRSLRQIVTGLGGAANGFAREAGFDITVASEVMAILCLATSLDDLAARLGNIIVGETRGGARERRKVRARELEADGAMTALLKDALMPNLVQTLEGNPAFVHGGPFANIAHGCNSVMATRAALRLGDYVVTEAGFGADLGAEKFFDIKCRKAGLKPRAAVLVATVRALKMHGGVAREALAAEDLGAVERGFANLERHLANLKVFGVPAVVAINRFATDTAAELDLVQRRAAALGVEAIPCSHWAEGGAGAEALAQAVVRLAEPPSGFRPLYPDALPLWEKIRTIAQTLYGAADISAEPRLRAQLDDYQQAGFGGYPVCIAKTQYSFSTDPTLKGAPSGHIVPVRELRLAGGAEFVVAICGDILTMPGLPRVPAANRIRLDRQGRIEGLS